MDLIEKYLKNYKKEKEKKRTTFEKRCLLTTRQWIFKRQ